MIKLKSHDEICYMRKAGKALAIWMSATISDLKRGVYSGADIAEDLTIYANSLGPEWDMPFANVRDYDDPVCVSINDEVVHSRPTKEPFKPGDVVTIDAGLSYNGYCADMARTIIVPGGEYNSKHVLLLGQTDMALRMARVKCIPGNRISDLSRAIYEVGVANGYGIVTHFSGHGIGADLHEDPQIPNNPDMIGLAQDDLLRPGMVICLEPMFILGGNSGITIGEDKWRVYSASGQVAAHEEDTILITPGDPEVLTVL